MHFTLKPQNCSTSSRGRLTTPASPGHHPRPGVVLAVFLRRPGFTNSGNRRERFPVGPAPAPRSRARPGCPRFPAVWARRRGPPAPGSPGLPGGPPLLTLTPPNRASRLAALAGAAANGGTGADSRHAGQPSVPRHNTGRRALDHARTAPVRHSAGNTPWAGGGHTADPATVR